MKARLVATATEAGFLLGQRRRELPNVCAPLELRNRREARQQIPNRATTPIAGPSNELRAW